MPRTKVQASLERGADDIEQAFYEALQAGDIERLMACWADEDEVVCVHPGGPRLVGAGSIRATFDSMFAAGSIQAHPLKVRKFDTPNCSVHSVLERVDLMTDDGLRHAYVLATNVYIRTPQGWRLLVHHASPGSARDSQELQSPAGRLH